MHGNCDNIPVIIPHKGLVQDLVVWLAKKYQFDPQLTYVHTDKIATLVLANHYNNMQVETLALLAPTKYRIAGNFCGVKNSLFLQAS